VADREIVVPLTDFQRLVLALLAQTRSPDSYLAGGAALHFAVNSIRYSNDLDFFHDSVERVATAFSADRALLEAARYEVMVELSQPGFIRALVARDDQSTRLDWAHDSAWRFMPPVRDALGGYLLHEIDLAVNKTLTLASRDEARDYVDILFIHERILALGALCWAAAGKDPGLTPLSLLELLKRRGRVRPEELARLHLAVSIDPVASKRLWLAALEQAEAFVRSRPVTETGCLYYSVPRNHFVVPEPDVDLASQAIVPHYGCLGGVLPQPSPM
jgi:hypothetical protein